MVCVDGVTVTLYPLSAQSVNKSDEDLPHIALYDKEIAEKDMPNIYGASDAFCLISRGEGFGLIYAEAGASGMPVTTETISTQAPSAAQRLVK